MRIAVTGSQCTGKSTFINDFLNRWPMYKRPEKTYRDIIKEKNLNLNRTGDRDSQQIILEALCEQAESNKDEEFCIHDRCVIDNLAYTCWLAAKGQGGVTGNDVTATIIQARQALKHYDVIFFLPISNTSPIPVEPKDNRDIDIEYRLEIDQFLKAFNLDYVKKKGKLFPTEDCPAVIEIFGDRSERMELAALYIKPNGNAFGDEDGSLISFSEDTESGEALSEFQKDELLRSVSKV